MVEFHTFKLLEKQAEQVHELVRSHIAAQHNYIATAVENGDSDKAAALVKELREYQDLYACFNMKAKRHVAEHTGKPMVTEHAPRG